MMPTKVFISYDEYTKEEFYSYIDLHPQDDILLWGPQNVYIPQLFKTQEEWISFYQDLDNRGINYKLVVGCSEFYNGHPNVISWDDYAAYDIIYRFVSGNVMLSPSPQNMEKHFVTNFGYETFPNTAIVDKLAKYNILDNTALHYYNNGNPFEFNYNYSPTHWDGLPSTLITDGFDIPIVRYFYLSAACQIVVEKDLNYPHINYTSLMPIVFGKMLVVFGAKGYYDKMKKLFGFDMFENIVDVSKFEVGDDIVSRSEIIAKELLRVTQNQDATMLARNAANAVSSNLQTLVNLVKEKNVDLRIKEMLELPELHEYKKHLNSGDKAVFMGKSIYSSS